MVGTANRIEYMAVLPLMEMAAIREEREKK
jgi:hypothetical protein